MKLEGLKANFLGDSITEGHGVENLEDTYWNVLKENVVWQIPGDMALEVPELQGRHFRLKIQDMIWIFFPEWKKWMQMQTWLYFLEEPMILDMGKRR